MLLYLLWTALHVFITCCRASDLSSQPRTFQPTDSMQALGENLGCVGVKLNSQTRSSLTKCIKACKADEACKYFTFLQKQKLCETFETCEEFVPAIPTDPEEKGVLFMKKTDCDVQLGLDGQGRYMQMITSQFPQNAVRSKNPNRNIWCRCVADRLMICGIFLRPDSREDVIVQKRLDRSDPDKLQPFFVLTSLYGNPQQMPMFFEPLDTQQEETVSAEIELMSMKSCIAISMCVQGAQGPICPVTKRHIRAGDPVYLLKNDAATVQQMKPRSILCISVAGLRQLIVTEQFIRHGGFVEPFKRIKGRLVTIPGDYQMYFAFSEKQLSEGVCASNSPITEDFPIMSVQEQQSNPMQEMLSKLGISRAGSSSHHESSPVTFTASSFRQKAGSGSKAIPSQIVHPGAELPYTPQHTASAGDFRGPRIARLVTANPSMAPTGVPTPMPLPELGTEQMIMGLKSEPGEQGMTGIVIERNLQSHKVTLKINTGEEITTIPENLIGEAEVLRRIKEVDKEDANLPDPENIIYPEVGKIHMIKGLVGRKELNGRTVKVLSIDKERKRIAVRIRDGDQVGEVVNVKPRNLIPPELMATYMNHKVTRVLESIMRERPTQSADFWVTNMPTSRVGKTNHQTFTLLFFTAFLFLTLLSFIHCTRHFDRSFYIEFEDSNTSLT